MLADILPTGYEVGVLNGQVQPGDVVAVVGAGPIGLSAISGARLFSPSLIVAIDMAAGAGSTRRSSSAPTSSSTTPSRIRSRPCGSSPAGSAPTSRSRPSECRRPSNSRPTLVRPAGRIANIGVHGKPVTLHLERLWSRDVTITTGLVDTYSTPTLLRLLASRPDRRAALRHPPFRLRRVHSGLRRVRRRGRHRGAQGRPQP